MAKKKVVRSEFHAYHFTLAQVRHLAVNYAISCEKGYSGSFDDWYANLSPEWREIVMNYQGDSVNVEERKIKKEIGL